MLYICVRRSLVNNKNVIYNFLRDLPLLKFNWDPIRLLRSFLRLPKIVVQHQPWKYFLDEPTTKFLRTSKEKIIFSAYILVFLLLLGNIHVNFILNRLQKEVSIDRSSYILSFLCIRWYSNYFHVFFFIN